MHERKKRHSEPSEGRELRCTAVTDISARREAEEALRASEERYRALVDAVDVGITLIDSDHKILAVNKKQAEFFGRDPEDFIGKRCFREYEGRAGVCPHCPGVQAMASGTPAGVETSGRRTDGSTFPVYIRASPVFDRDGRTTGFVEVVEDIADRKRTEAALQRAKVAAEAANLAKSEFLANVSHEIRTPMTAILGFSDLLTTPDLPPQQQREFLEGIRRNGEALLTLINAILDLSGIEADRLTLEKADCPLQPTIDNVVSTVKVQAEKKGLRLEVDYQPPLPEEIHTDQKRLRQILVNLLGNAVKFTEHGEVRMTVRYRREGDDDARMQFSIADTGVGIPADKIHELFQPFVQADTSASRHTAARASAWPSPSVWPTRSAAILKSAANWGKEAPLH